VESGLLKCLNVVEWNFKKKWIVNISPCWQSELTRRVSPFDVESGLLKCLNVVEWNLEEILKKKILKLGR